MKQISNLLQRMSPPLSVGVIGSRAWNNSRAIENILKGVVSHADVPMTFVSGGAKGADTLSVDYVLKHNAASAIKHNVVVHKPQWNNTDGYNRGAGFARNRTIVDDCSLIIAFWDGVSLGTLDSMRIALESNKPVILVVAVAGKNDLFSAGVEYYVMDTPENLVWIKARQKDKVLREFPVIYSQKINDMLLSSTQVIVNPCNTMGVFGAGLSRLIAEAYGKMATQEYIDACQGGTLADAGDIVLYYLSKKVYNSIHSVSHRILHFPTKRHYRDRSDLNDIRERLIQWRDNTLSKPYTVAFPLLGAGLGGLSAEAVVPMMADVLSEYSQYSVIYL